MKTSHLQSLIAQNANRITKLHNQHANFLEDAASFNRTVSQLYQKHVDGCRDTAFKAAFGVKKDIAKAVELQKALQADLRSNREAERAIPALTSVFYTHNTGFLDGTFCVEIISDDSHTCHMLDGTSNPHPEGQMKDLFKQAERNGTLTKHTTRQYPDVQAPRVYNIAFDGQPKKDGAYDVYYRDSDISTTGLYFVNGAWRFNDNPEGAKSGFGNIDTDKGYEYYIVK